MSRSGAARRVPTRPSARFVTAVVAGVAAAATGLAGCSSSPHSTSNPAVAPPLSAPCVASHQLSSAPVTELAAAALLTADIEVAAQPSAEPTCTSLVSGMDVHLLVGDRASFVANGPPVLVPAAGVVTVSTSAGPAGQGPTGAGPGGAGPGGAGTAHVIVTLTAVHAGQVSVRWIDCSGTGC